jgi:hypothetical protein
MPKLQTLTLGPALVLALVAALVLSSPGRSAPASNSGAAETPNAVLHWGAVAEAAIAAARPPASSSVLSGMVYGAVYDAVAAAAGGLEPFATGVTAPAGASVDAAVAQAARDVLVARVPAQAANVQAAYDAYLAELPDGPTKDRGKAVGAAAAAGMLAMRTGDGFDDAVPYVQQPPGPGVFEPLAPTIPVDVKLGAVRPFTFATQSEYRPDGPLDLTTGRYARDLREVQAYGRATSSVRTAAQTETVRFFTEHTFVQYGRALRTLAADRGLDVRSSARLLALAHVSLADTMIACWEAKYHYAFWRPTHAIQRADTDGNAATAPEPAWLPLVTANHPEYPSGHGCYNAALTQTLHRFFGTKRVPLTITSTVTGTSRTYSSLDDLVSEVEDARVWGGLHFRTTMTDTHADFPRVARDVAQRYFRLARPRS